MISSDLFYAIVLGLPSLNQPASSRNESILISLIIIVSLSVLIGGGFTRLLFFTASDYQYLLTLPISKDELRKAVYLYNFLFGLFFKFSTIVLPAIALGLPGIAVGLLLYIMLGSLGSLLLYPNFMFLLRLLLMGLAISAYFHFPYSFLSMFVYPNDYFSYIILSTFSLPFLILSCKTFYIETTLEDRSIRRTSKTKRGSKKWIHIKFPNIIRTVPRSRNNVQTTEMYVDFTKMSPRKAILLISLFYSSPMREFRWYKSFMGSRIMAIISFIIWLTNNPALVPLIIVNGIGMTLLIFALSFGIIGVLSGYIEGTFKQEPIWLSFGLIEPVTYARYYILGKSLSVFSMFLPLAIALFFIPKGLASGILVLSTPFVYIVTASLYVRVLQGQSLDYYILGYKTSTRTLLLGFASVSILIVYMVLALISIFSYSMIFVKLAVVLLLLPMIVSVFLLYNRKLWKRIVNKMVENEFLFRLIFLGL